jgi:Mg/Co/Ni transporter MgtE
MGTIQELLKNRLEFLHERDDAAIIRRLPTWQLAMMRLPALMLTLTLEIGVGAIISSYNATIRKHILIASFIPILASVAGNMAMQTSSSTLRSLSKGYINLYMPRTITTMFMREAASTGYVAGALSVMVFIVAGHWGGLRFGFITAVSIFLACVVAGLLGAMTPIAFKYFDIDPAAMSGPLETALQDMAGNSLYLALCSLYL